MISKPSNPSVVFFGDKTAEWKAFRLIEWAGVDREKLGWVGLDESIPSSASVIIPLGNAALQAIGGKGGTILKIRGYVQQGPRDTHLVPTVHPSFIQRGQSKYSAAFIADLQKAMELADHGLPIEPVSYLLDPSPLAALQWARSYAQRVERGETIRLAYDIEAPGKGEDEGAIDDDDPTYTIWRIGFSYEPFSALSIPWTPPYIPAIRILLGSYGEKVVWNAGYDNPRIRAAGVQINGLIHDGMVAWHILHSDLPKGLGFVATFTCPWQPAWKHLSGSKPAFYNATDADVELRSYLAIERWLKESGLWKVYQEDVLDLEPILIHMNRVGMPVDGEVRLDRAIRLAEKQQTVLGRLESLTPLSIRTYTPKEGYVKTPEDTNGCVSITVVTPVRRCSICGAVNPTKPHFRTFKRPTPSKPQNPCAGGEVVIADEPVERFARLDPFKPSRNLILRYQHHLNRIIPLKWDKKAGKKKPTTDEKALKTLIGKYPDDPFYPSVLEYRGLDKLAGTYIGRPVYEAFEEAA